MKKNNKIFVEACYRRPVPYTPLWIMRQAGRYLPEYRKIRKEFTFHEMMFTPDLMTEVTLQPLRRYNFDAAIMFSDILVIPEAMGIKFELIKNIGPVFNEPLNNLKKIDSLKKADINKLKYVFEGIKQIRSELDKSKALIGFTGSPWTIACYMVEGKPSKDYRNLRSLMYSNPISYHQLMQTLTDSIINYVTEQIKSGTDAIQIFDTNASFLSKEMFAKNSFPYLKQIINCVNSFNVPCILFVKGGGNWLDLLKKSGAQVLGIDWTVTLKDARAMVQDKVTLQGNLDPSVLLSNIDIVKKETIKVLESYGVGNGHIFNLGHGITPDVSTDAVKAVIETVQKESKKFKTNG